MSFRRTGVVAATRRELVACAAVLCAIGGCSSFDGSLLDQHGAATPGPGTGAHDAGQQPTQMSEPDARVMPAPDAGMVRDSGTRPGIDAGHARPPGDLDAGADDDAGQSSACEPTPVDDFCLHLPALAAAPKIDGVLDCGPKLRALTPLGWNGTAAIPTGHATKLAAAWRADGLYVYVEVHGQTPAPHPSGSEIYCGDAVELYIDADGVLDTAGNYDKPGTMQFVIGAPGAASSVIEAMRYVQGSAHGAWTSSRIKTRLLPDGYAIETFIVATDLDLAAWTPVTRIGIDVGIDVSAPLGAAGLKCGQQIGQYFMHIDDQAGTCNHEPWCDSHAFCAPQL